MIGPRTEANELHQQLRQGVRELCQRFPDAYWRELDAARAYPDAFVKALTEAGYLAALIPEDYGGSGLGDATPDDIVVPPYNSTPEAMAKYLEWEKKLTR